MHTNRLIDEKSPYLLQHAHNPVEWHAWGEEAFRIARERDKPIFLSVGYSTCHWCHVMERESFENEEIAALLNREFVSIKVDREERPDVDRVYMLFVQATTGSGGWPMSVWLTPDLKPFYGGTYFPPESQYGRPGFVHILEQIAQAWREQREKLVESSREILAELEKHTLLGAGAGQASAAALDSCFYSLRRSFDPKHGGFGGAPKFPRPVVLNFLFRYYHRTGNHEARDMALQTLREMARGGMHDQLGGGFHRYSVDERWFVPHFEKMLYDQAQLAVSYLEAFQITGDGQYAAVARDVLDYVLRDMTHPEGGFYSAEDADSVIDPANPHEKGEGAFYVWTTAQLRELLGEERAQWFISTFGCRESGNVANDPHGEFSGRNILFQANGVDPGSPELSACREILLPARSRRVRPGRDDKILTSWNGMMISAFAKGARVLGDPRYFTAARNSSEFITSYNFCRKTGLLQRRWRDGDASIDGFLDDYAAFAQAQLDLYETTFEPTHLDFAARLATTMLDLFEDTSGGGFFAASPRGESLVLRLKDDYDGAEPSGNSLAAGLLLRLSRYTGSTEFERAANAALSAFAARINDQPFTLPQVLCALMEQLAPKSEISFSGPAAELVSCFRNHFRPFTTVAWKDQTQGNASALLCENQVCLPPAASVQELTALLN